MFVLENEIMPTKRGGKKAGKETPLVSSIVVFQEWCEWRLQHFGTAGSAYRQAGVQLAGVRRT